MAHLGTGADCPPEYLELVLCRDVYHCTPIELENVPAPKIMAHLVCLRAEGKVRATQQMAAEQRARHGNTRRR